MCGPYWSQWDSEDLDSWIGRDSVDNETDAIDYLDPDELEADSAKSEAKWWMECPVCQGGGCEKCLL